MEPNISFISMRPVMLCWWKYNFNQFQIILFPSETVYVSLKKATTLVPKLFSSISMFIYEH
jgi:hypothetical protein